MSSELKKRILTSIALFVMLFLAFLTDFVLLFLLIIIYIFSLFEFMKITEKIFQFQKTFKYLSNLIFIIYLSIFVFLFFLLSLNQQFKILIFYLIMICILSDIGGLLFGRIFKGPKLTKISPKKTITGSIGSFFLPIIFSLMIQVYYSIPVNLSTLIFFTLLISLGSQLGDILFSFLKRKSKLKDTGNILPGHGGLLDRIDGILLGIPVGLIALIILS